MGIYSKNYAKGYSDMQIKVREATSNDPWGPSGTIMNEIAQSTFNKHDFTEVMDMIDKRLNDKGKNWRHVFKSLTLLDYCLHVGSEDVVSYAKENMYVVKTLKEFQHIDDNGKDVGANVRQKAKDITNLLSDDVRLRDERQQRSQMRDRMAGVDNIMDLTRRGESSTPTYDRPGYLDDERDLRRALEESKRLAEEEERNRRTGDSDLSKALQESEREAREKEVKERDQINRHNEAALLGGDNETPSDNNGFGAFPQQQNFDSSFSHSANPYLQQQNQQMPQQQQQWIGNQATGQLELADAFSNPVQSSQPMFPQVTGYQQSNPYQQQQQTSYNPYQQQQQEQFSSMQQPQVTGFGQQPTQQFDMDQQFTGMQQFQQPQQTGMSNNPFGQFGNQTSFGGNDQFQQAFAQQPQQTGFSQGFNSNNFTTTGSTPSFASQNLQPNVTGQVATSTGSPASRQTDQKYAKLNALLSSGEGQDTFGNTGNMRIPVGTGFANSIKWQPPNTNEQKNSADLLGLGSESNSSGFSQNTSRNPFGQASNAQQWNSPRTGQKSLVELMQEQKQQQANVQPQMTGFGGVQPQSTGWNNGQQQQQQQQPFSQQQNAFF
ncbi:unnamed protein product [Umbelopsis sp. WA50703]